MTRRTLLASPLAAVIGLRVSELPPLPEAIAGQFAGTHGGRLIVAGGTLWTRPKWEGGEKRWTPAIYSLGPGESSWRKSGEQSEPLAYGGVVSIKSGVVCIGGQGPSSASASVRLLFWDGSAVRQRSLADLPQPRMLLGAALFSDVIYAVGGQAAPDAPGVNTVWLLEKLEGKWREVASLPGPGRILPAVAGFREGFYVASGAALDKTLKRDYLRDAFEFRGSWRPLPPLPTAVVAATACCDDMQRFLIFGGDDGSLAGRELGASHPGFRRAILRFEKGDWREIATFPQALVTSSVARWGTSLVIPGGEDRPGSRSSKVISIQGLIG